MNLMKSGIISLMFLTGMGTAFGSAPPPQSSPLTKQKIGDVIYSVSNSNRIISLQMPFIVKLNLLEMDDVPEEDKYTIAINGAWDTNLSRQEVVDLCKKYPDYKIAGESQSVAVEDCSIKLSDGTDVECMIPPATGAYFNVFNSLSKKVGDRLKTELAANRYPDINVTIRYNEPWATGSQKFEIHPRDVCKGLMDKNGKVSLISTLRGLVAQVPQLRVPNPRLVGATVDAILDACIDPLQVRLEGSATNLSALLETELRMKDSLQESVTISKEDLVWKEAHGRANLTIQISVK